MAVVCFREQLGNRPSAVRLYQGYPFDRLRRRLGLEPTDPAATDPADLTCASPWELDWLDPEPSKTIAWSRRSLPPPGYARMHGRRPWPPSCSVASLWRTRR